METQIQLAPSHRGPTSVSFREAAAVWTRVAVNSFVALLVWLFGPQDVYVKVGLFFSKTAVRSSRRRLEAGA